MKKLAHIISKLTNHFLAFSDIALNATLFMIYKFDFWHVLATPYRRPYKMAVLQFLSGKHSYQVIDVGCGLGDIIKGGDDAIGLDRSLSTLRAAKRKNFKPTYLKYEFGVVKLQEILIGIQTDKPIHRYSS